MGCGNSSGGAREPAEASSVTTGGGVTMGDVASCPDGDRPRRAAGGCDSFDGCGVTRMGSMCGRLCDRRSMGLDTTPPSRLCGEGREEKVDALARGGGAPSRLAGESAREEEGAAGAGTGATYTAHTRGHTSNACLLGPVCVAEHTHTGRRAPTSPNTTPPVDVTSIGAASASIPRAAARAGFTAEREVR